MELTVQDYMQLLPRAQHDLLKQCLEALQVATASAPKHEADIVQLLISRPYPILQILQLSSPQIDTRRLGQIITEALRLLLNSSANIYTPQLINFLTNFPLHSLDAPALSTKLVQRLATPPLNDDAYLALIARVEPHLLIEVLEYSQRQWQRCAPSGIPAKEFVLYQALRHKQHFVPLIVLQLKNIRQIEDVALRHNFLLLKLVNEFSNTKQTLADLGNINKWLDEFVVADSPPDLQEVHRFFYADFKRIWTTVEFLKKYSDIYKSIPIESLLNTSSILKLLYEHDIDASFEDTRRIIESIHKWQLQMPTIKNLYELEIETLNYYAALTTVYDMVMADASFSLDQYYVSQVQQLNSMLRRILNIEMLCALIEDIFQLVFLRWEHLNCDSSSSYSVKHSSRSRSTRSSSSNSTDGAAAETPTQTARAAVTTTKRHGFICRGRALQSIFTFLKNFVTKKLHSEDYKLASERLQLRFQRIVKIITEALWKYSVLEKIDDSLTRAGMQQQLTLEPEDLLQLVQMHVDTMEKSSSDDESRDRSNYTSLTRRKLARKKRRATFSGAAGLTRPTPQTLEAGQTRASIMVSSMDTIDPMTQLRARKLVRHFLDRSIIPQMLCSPENLAIMALALKNFNDVKYIIETFNLQNTELNRELTFVEQQQQVKQRLITIYANYQQQEQSNSSKQGQPKATVEQIKHVAAKGFEVSKIISVIDNFSQSQRIQQTAEQQQLLLKHSNNPQYNFLHQFEERNLNAVIVTDLILSLPFNHEIISNVLMVIRRQQQMTSKITKDEASADATPTATTKTQMPKEIGPMSLLENLHECLRLLEGYTLHDLLCNNYYSLKPRKLAAELQRERAFHAVFYKTAAEIGRSDDLKTHMPLFQNLQSKCNYYQRFCAYAMQLAQLVRLRDRNLEYHTNTLLKIDPCDVIGELIFECNMTPLEIEANVSALNLNLVHVIALNVCPEVAGKCTSNRVRPTIAPQKEESILNYISNHNQLLAYLLQGIINSNNVKNSTVFSENLNSCFLQRFMALRELHGLSKLFSNNLFIAALQSDSFDIMQIMKLESKTEQLKMLQLEMGRREPKSAQRARIDKLIMQLIEENPKNIHLAAQIHDIALRAELIQQNFTKISTTKLAKELIENTLQHKEAALRIPTKLRVQLEETLVDITIYAKVSEVLQFETWPQAYDFGLKTPNAIFEKLLLSHLYKLCYNWCKVVKLAERFVQQKRLFLSALLKAFLQLRDDNDREPEQCREVNTYLLQILETFPFDDCISFLDTNKDKFRSLALLKYAVSFLSENTPDSENYRNYKISLVIFEQLTPSERAHFWNLLKFPLLIIEQLIMNAKFEILNKVLTAVRAVLQHGDMQSAHVCDFCFDKRGHIYNIHTRSPTFHLGAADAGNSTNSAFILLNFNLYQKNHIITNECIDLLLRIYATKALDYHISNSAASSSEQISQTTDMQQSLDSLCGAFQIPPSAPARDEWVRDEEATHCMCCARAVFTMLMRRHHCRRCGRVVCFACSTHRMRIPELYAEVEVRICNDCYRITAETQQKLLKDASSKLLGDTLRANRAGRDTDVFKWKLSGNITHDKLLREEFCYDHSPSVALCLSILGYHLGKQKCVDLLLYHCHKLEKLIVPNPEINYELVAKMMNCLALAAKVRGGPAEVETIREHSEIIISVVQNGCETLIPTGPLNNHSLRKLRDSLVQAEKWDLALEVHLKCGFPIAGVMAAHGLSCLKAGCFDTAREKFTHCMPKLSSEQANSRIQELIVTPLTADSNENPIEWSRKYDIPYIKRPQRGPPLLQEILKIIAATPIAKPQPETLQRASIIRNSNSSLASLLSRRKDPCPIRMHEPALNILTTLGNLKRIAKGQYGETSEQQPLPDNAQRSSRRQTCAFNECMYYVLTYGSHTDVLQFLIRLQELVAALKYFLVQNLETDLFIQNIFLVSLRNGEMPLLIERMREIDERLLIWQSTLLQTCRYLETQQLLNSLYQLQVLLKDPVRASMTCVKFYSMNCENFQQLHANALHLNNAQKHLQSELELAQWENLNLEPAARQRKTSANSVGRTSTGSATSSTTSSFVMQMDARSLNSHINTISMQLEVAKFLANCEKENSTNDGLITLKILKQIRGDVAGKTTLPTLFEAAQDKIQLCILILLCGKNIDEGFGLAYRIIHDYKLPPMKVFAASAKYLALNERLSEVEKLLNCITSNNGHNTRDIDEILSIAINSAPNSHEPDVKAALDNLTKKINNVELRISCHIFIGQLKSAYLLANKYERLADVRKILRHAELTNQVHIKKLCEKKLNINVVHDPL